MRRSGSILIGLLWCVVLLALVVISVLHMATMDLRVAKNYGDKIQAHYLALAGIEKARALLHQDAQNQGRNGGGRAGDLLNAPDQFRDLGFGRGQFRVFRRGTQAEGGGIIYGVSDEESRLNVNTATAEEFTNLDGLTVDIAASILAWRGQTNPAGANADYYASLLPPYEPRNGPIQTVRELLMVRGVTPELLFGSDTRQNGFLPDADDEEGNSSNQSLDVDSGWAAFLTVDSTEANVNATGQDRVNIQNADEAALSAIRGITPSIARAIVSYRNQHRFQSIADLLNVTPPNQNGRPTNPGNAQSDQTGQSDQAVQADPSDSIAGGGSGSVVIDETLLMEIADDLTADSSKTQTGLVNINTASLQTLLCLPGMDRTRAQAIVSHVRSQGSMANIAYLLRVPGMDRQLFKQVAPLVTARSETFRILSEGRIKSTGTSQRIQVTVHVSAYDVVTLSYREDSL